MILVAGLFLAAVAVFGTCGYLAFALPVEVLAWVGRATFVGLPCYVAFRAYRKFFDI